MNLKRGHGSIQLTNLKDGQPDACHVCLSATGVKLLRFNSPQREHASQPREPGSVFVRICGACRSGLREALAKDAAA